MGQAGASNKVYVTDIFEITLRTGPSTENKIIKLLSSGQSLEVLEVQGDWSRVNVLENGQEKQEGWVLNRYLIRRPPYKMQVNSLQEENKRLKERLAPSERQLIESANREKELSGELQDCQAALHKLENEFESLKRDSSEYLKLKASNKTTLSKLESAETQLKEISTENEKLRASQRNRWFITGALVLLCGFLIGLVLGRQSRKRKSSYY
jgi:SH3 domain protein